MPVVWVSTCQAVNGARPAASSSGSQRESGAVSGKRPVWARRMTVVATIGLVIDASRQTALVPIRGPSSGGNASIRTSPSAPATATMANGTVPASTWRSATANAVSKACGSGACAGIATNDTPPGRNLAAEHPRRDAMPTTIRSLGLRLVLAAAVAAGVGACSLLPPGTVPEAFAPGRRHLRGVRRRVPAGPVRLPGRDPSRRPGGPQRRHGADRGRVVAAAARRARSRRPTGTAILAQPFTGECPTNVDGQEQVYTFHREPARRSWSPPARWRSTRPRSRS